MTSGVEGDIPISTLMLNLSQEIRRLSGVAADLDSLLANIVASNLGAAPEQMVGMQSIDSLRQALDAITNITSSAAKLMPDHPDIAVAKSGLAQGVTVQTVLDACLFSGARGVTAAADTSAMQPTQSNAAMAMLFFDE